MFLLEIFDTDWAGYLIVSILQGEELDSHSGFSDTDTPTWVANLKR